MARQRSGYHLSLSLSKELWSDLLSAALPVKVAGGDFDLARNAKAGLRQLGVRERVAGLIEQNEPPQTLVRARDRAVAEWQKRRATVYARIDDLVRVRGTYKLELDDVGSKLSYGVQKVGADAYLKGRAEGTIVMLRENVEIPFVLERRVGVSLTLGEIHYEPSQSAVIGSLRDLGLHLGDNAALQLIARAGEYLLEQQLPRVNPVPILKRAQVDEMVGGLGGPLKMKMGVSDIDLQVTEDDLTLSVKFGFTQLQIEEKDLPEGD